MKHDEGSSSIVDVVNRTTLIITTLISFNRSFMQNVRLKNAIKIRIGSAHIALLAFTNVCVCVCCGVCGQWT